MQQSAVQRVWRAIRNGHYRLTDHAEREREADAFSQFTTVFSSTPIAAATSICLTATRSCTAARGRFRGLLCQGIQTRGTGRRFFAMLWEKCCGGSCLLLCEEP